LAERQELAGPRRACTVRSPESALQGLAWRLQLRAVMLRWLLVPLLILALTATPAVGLSRRELLCQAAIGRAAHAFLVGELAAGARCRMKAIVGRECDDEDRAEARQNALLRRIAAKCRDVTFANLIAGSCAAGVSTLDALVDCLAAGHRDLVEQALDAEYGTGE
jgi:hypothetical protein